MTMPIDRRMTRRSENLNIEEELDETNAESVALLHASDGIDNGESLDVRKTRRESKSSK